MRWGLCVLGCACVAGFVVPVGAQVQFANVTAEKGFGNIDSVPGDGHAPGAVFTDLNKDGYPDAYIPGGRNWSAGQMLPNRLYLNVPDGAGGRRF